MPTLTPRQGPPLLPGASPGLVAMGLKPGSRATIHGYRLTRVFKPGDTKGEVITVHSHAEFQVDAEGRIDVDRTAPVSGTYQGVDPLGLLWSGERMTEPGPEVKPRQALFRLEPDGAPEASVILELTDGSENVEVQAVHRDGWNGVLALPKTAHRSPLPSILLLHGSNGGSMESARALAVRFAQLGYAALGVNYFAYSGEDQLPRALMNIPVETLEKARAWLAQQPGVDAERVSIWGASKGAEFALVAAAHLPWVDRVIACVPSSVVWAGFGRELAANESPSSWSFQGKSLPFVRYDGYEDVLQGRLSSGAVHVRSLQRAAAEERNAARIPIENTRAKILLMGATRDQVWPSASMVKELEAAMSSAGKSSQVTTLIFENASHFVCGVGTEMTKINPVRTPEHNDPLPEADARGSAAGWAATKAFLKRD